MPRLYRAMKESSNGQPQIGGSARTLGVRLGIDIPATVGTNFVQPIQGGVSVSPNDPLNLPQYRRPPEFGGNGSDPVWFLEDSHLGLQLCYRADPTNTRHGFIEPAYLMTADEYCDAVTATRPLWRKVIPA